MTGKKVESMLSWFCRHYDEFKEEEKKNLFENAEDIAKSINSDCVIWER